ncbi:MAG: DUF4367 domain-containing protein [Ruminococcaceae bacterium]|nr:DUF4367 domain-containing protein [Oscillospiraceae bacterium]
MTSDEILKAALIQTADEHFSRYDTAENERPHRFSLAFYIRKISVERLARKAEKTAPRDLPQRRYMPLKRLVLIMAVIFAAVFLTAAAWVAYISVRGFIFEVHTTHSDVTIDPALYEIKEEITEFYWLPSQSGCEYVSEIGDNEEVIQEYEMDGKQVLFVQHAGDYVNNSIGVNTEFADVYDVKVKDNDGFVVSRIVSDSDERSTFIIWIENGYVFSIHTSGFSNDELVDLAEQIEVKLN